jgi:imidazolonepropionase-like amidohydrolase
VLNIKDIGQMDILFGGSKILSIAKNISLESLKDNALIGVIDVTGMIVTPGLIDVHVHVTGGGLYLKYRILNILKEAKMALQVELQKPNWMNLSLLEPRPLWD